jgi:hypothetical protein
MSKAKEHVRGTNILIKSFTNLVSFNPYHSQLAGTKTIIVGRFKIQGYEVKIAHSKI